jgi:hypothetical protein
MADSRLRAAPKGKGTEAKHDPQGVQCSMLPDTPQTIPEPATRGRTESTTTSSPTMSRRRHRVPPPHHHVEHPDNIAFDHNTDESHDHDDLVADDHTGYFRYDDRYTFGNTTIGVLLLR